MLALTLAVQFQNTFTVPSVMLQSTLAPNDLPSGLATLALFLLGWSPLLWSAAPVLLKPEAYLSRGFGTRNIQKQATASRTFDPATVHTIARSVSTSVRYFVSSFTTPPLWGAFAGIILGTLPIVRDAFIHSSAPIVNLFPAFGAAGGTISWFWFTLIDAASLVGSAAIGLQAIVLAGSLARSFLREKHAGRSIVHAVRPTLRELRALVPICLARLLVTPTVMLALLHLAFKLGWLQSSGIQVLLYTLMVMSATPPAQNLVLIAQVASDTTAEEERTLPERLARMILLTYVVSAVPLALWSAYFASLLVY